jgi:hypothetical protein
MTIDIIFILHLIFLIFFLTIPFWKIKYLKYLAYAPLILSTLWIICGGCPLTHIQKNLNDELFSQILLKPVFPNVTKEEVVRFTYYILILITVISFYRLKEDKKQN